MELFKIESLKDIILNPANHKAGEEVFNKLIVEGDLSLLAGDTNCGKSLLAADIVFANNNGLCFWEEPINNRIRKAIYIDGEMSDSQIAQRYEHILGHTSEDLIWVSPVSLVLDRSVEDILRSIENLICEHPGISLLVVDNLMSILPVISAKQIKMLMQGLKQLKEKYALTIILVIHLNKRNRKKPIEIRDIQGSSILSNYADSIIAIGNSCDGDHIKYLKQLKSRSTIKMSEVAVMEIKESPYLHFEFCGYDEEENHLASKSNSRCRIPKSMEDEILSLKEEGLSIRNIADQLGFSKSTLGRFLKKNS